VENVMKKVLILAALAGALAMPVFAQTTAPAPGISSTFYSQTGEAEWRASKLMGLKVTNDAGDTIGDINDLLVDKSSKVGIVVIGVGGFLGMGERHAAFKYDALQLTRGTDNNPVVRVSTTKDQIKAMPEWQWNPANGELRTNKLMGANVSNTAGETIGNINDVLIDKDGKLAAVVIGVGGFLGMGERHAAVPFSSLDVTRDANNDPLVRVNLTKDQLKTAPEWKWQPVSGN
jgi:sporulation protein YlmC with PRC-barrel domain